MPRRAPPPDPATHTPDTGPAAATRAWRSLVLVAVLVAAGYAAGSQLAWQWFGAGGSASFFPAAGVTVAALLLVARRDWPVVLAAAGLAEIAVDLAHGLSPAASVGYAGANLLQPLVAVTLLTALAPRPDLRRLRDLALFVLCAVAVAPLAGGIAGASVFVLFDGGSGWGRFAADWWVGDGLGVLVVAPAILALAGDRPRGPQRRRSVETALYVGATGLASAAAFWLELAPMVFAVVALLLGAGFRHGTAGAALSGAATAFVAAHATARGHAWWDALGVGDDLGRQYLQAAIGVLVLGSLAVAAALGERDRALAERLRAASALRRAERQEREARRVRRLAERLASALTPQAVCAAFIDEAIDLTGARTGWIRVDGAPGDAPVTATAGSGDGGDAVSWIDLPVPGPQGPIGRVRLGVDADGDAVDGALLGTLLEVLGQAVPRAFLYAAERESRLRAEVLQRNATRLRTADGAAEVAAATIADLREAGMDAAAVVVADGDELRTLASHGPVPAAAGPQGPVRRAVRDRATVVEDGGPGGPVVVAVPLTGADGRCLGALVACGPAGAASPPGVRLVTALAEQTGLALGRAEEADRRRVVEGELAERHRFIDEMTALAPGIVYVFDLVGRRSTYVTDRVSTVLGYSPEELCDLGDRFLEALVHPDDAAPLAEHLEALSRLPEGASATACYRFRTRDGRWKWFESHDTARRRDGDGRVTEVIGIATVIDDRKAAEAAAHAAADADRYRARLGDALRSAAEPEEAVAAAGRLLAAHLAVPAVRFVPVSEGGWLGRLLELVDGVSAVVRPLDATARAVMVALAEGVTLRADGGVGEAAPHLVAPVHREGRPAAALVVRGVPTRAWTDLEAALVEETAERVLVAVERAHAVRELADREARYRSLFGAIDEGFALCEIIEDRAGRPVDYRFLEVNGRFREQTGLADPVGRTALELVPDLEPHWIETYARAGIGGETLRFESAAQALGRWFDVFAAPVGRPGSGRFVAVFTDVTERRRAEEAVRRREEDERRARRRAELMAAVAGALDATERLRDLPERLLGRLVPSFADFAVIEVPGDDDPVLAVAHRDPAGREALAALRSDHRLRADDAHSMAGVADGTPLLMSEIEPARYAEYTLDGEALRLLDRLAPRSVVAVPLDVAGRRGVLMAGRSDPGRNGFDRADLETAEAVAARAALAFGRARIHDEEQAVVMRLQTALLPERLVEHPAVQVAATYRTGSELLVGGDWYDAFRLPDGRLAFAVGDVVGHGLDAAAAMGRLRVALVALAPGAATPERLLHGLNRFALGPSGVEFATAAYVVLDPATGALQYASAGHPPALLVRASGEVEWLEEGRTVPLGVWETPRGPACGHRVLGAGDLLLLYSDGLVERRRESLDAGLERLREAAVRLRSLPVEEVCDRLITEAAGMTASDDDTVVLAVRFGPVSATSFHRVLPAVPVELAATRRALRAWCAGAGVPEAVAGRLLLATGEALANAVEHGGSAEPVDLRVAAAPGRLRVRIADRGRWRPGEETRPEGRGRGTRIMRSLTRDFLRRTDAGGTTVSFDVPHRARHR